MTQFEGHPTTKHEENGGDHKIVFSELTDFLWRQRQLYNNQNETNQVEDIAVSMDPSGGRGEVKDDLISTSAVINDNNIDDIAADDHIHIQARSDATFLEPAVGKGLSATLHLLRQRGTLNEGVVESWAGKNYNMDVKKSRRLQFVGVDHGHHHKYNNEKLFDNVQIERRDEFGRIVTKKEEFRRISHAFHGKWPGKKKQEKQMKRYHQEQKLKQMKSSDTPLLLMEKMRDAQARLQSPYLVL